MQVTAKAKYIKMSPRKIRLVSDMIKGMKVSEALNQLQYIPKSACRPLQKLINSGIAAAENDLQLKKDNLFIKNILVNEGPTLYRWQPRAFGRATPLRKRSAHILLILDELVPTAKAKKTGKKKKEKEEIPVIEKPEDLTSKPKVSPKGKIPKQQKPVKEEVPLDEKREISRKIEEEKGEGKEIFDPRREGKHRHKQHVDKREMKGSKGFLKKVFKRKAN